VLENRRDEATTKAWGFHSKKSFISFAGHVYLYGIKDHAVMRNDLWERSNGMCEGCHPSHFLDVDTWQWHHAQKTLGGRRCDGLCCALAVCPSWHEKHHNRSVRFGEGRGESAET